MKIVKIIGEIYDANVFVVEKNGFCLIIDAGAKLEEVKRAVGENKVAGILLTHGHFDHCAFVVDYIKAFGCKVYANKNIVQTMTDKTANYSEGGQTFSDFSNFVLLDEDQKLELGEFEVACHYLPGHCHCCEGYIIENVFFAGDFLFEKSFGRVDLKFSDKNKMLESLLKSKELNYQILQSGHGESSTKKEQLQHLPLFLKFIQR